MFGQWSNFRGWCQWVGARLQRDGQGCWEGCWCHRGAGQRQGWGGAGFCASRLCRGVMPFVGPTSLLFLLLLLEEAIVFCCLKVITWLTVFGSSIPPFKDPEILILSLNSIQFNPGFIFKSKVLSFDQSIQLHPISEFRLGPINVLSAPAGDFFISLVQTSILSFKVIRHFNCNFHLIFSSALPWWL